VVIVVVLYLTSRQVIKFFRTNRCRKLRFNYYGDIFGVVGEPTVDPSIHLGSIEKIFSSEKSDALQLCFLTSTEANYSKQLCLSW